MNNNAIAAPGAAPNFSLFPLQQWRVKKARGERIAMISLYDAPSAALCCEAGADALLVGDSLGNVVLGFDNTIAVTIEDMRRHTGAVVRGARRSSRPQVPVVADLPFASYHGAVDATIGNGAILMREGAAALKLEGAAPNILRSIEALVSMGAPVVGHLGFTPQSALTFERVVQGRESMSATRLLEEAAALESAGCSAIVLEAVAQEVAAAITKRCRLPIIGIGAGNGCDGQVLVWHDLAGLTPSPVPRFVRRFAQLHGEMQNAARDYVQAVHDNSFPAAQNSWSMTEPQPEWNDPPGAP